MASGRARSECVPESRIASLARESVEAVDKTEGASAWWSDLSRKGRGLSWRLVDALSGLGLWWMTCQLFSLWVSPCLGWEARFVGILLDEVVQTYLPFSQEAGAFPSLEKHFASPFLTSKCAKLRLWWRGIGKAKCASVGSVYTGRPFIHLILGVVVRKERGSGRINTELCVPLPSRPLPVLWGGVVLFREDTVEVLVRMDLVLLVQGGAGFLNHDMLPPSIFVDGFDFSFMLIVAMCPLLSCYNFLTALLGCAWYTKPRTCQMYTTWKVWASVYSPETVSVVKITDICRGHQFPCVYVWDENILGKMGT